MRTACINITQRVLHLDAMPPLSHHRLQRSVTREEGEGDGGDAIVPQHKKHFNQSLCACSPVSTSLIHLDVPLCAQTAAPDIYLFIRFSVFMAKSESSLFVQ